VGSALKNFFCCVFYTKRPCSIHKLKVTLVYEIVKFPKISHLNVYGTGRRTAAAMWQATLPPKMVLQTGLGLASTRPNLLLGGDAQKSFIVLRGGGCPKTELWIIRDSMGPAKFDAFVVSARSEWVATPEPTAYIGFFDFFFCECARSLTQPFFRPSQPGSCAWLSPFLLCADSTCVLMCVCLCMCMWKCVGKVINI